MSEWLASSSVRTKKLDPYEMIIQTWLSEHQDLSSAQVHDWLKEKYPALHVGSSTVRLFVKEVREKYRLPKIVETRTYEAVPECPPGHQAQVDFGKTTQRTPEGDTQKLTFISIVLSHSRYKYVEWLDRPFTTNDVIQAHENAFQYFGGIPYEMIYDQDALVVVDENAGDILWTHLFQSYKQERRLNVKVCRRADPESKGKIENVVGYIKKNFAKNRVFQRLDEWNAQCWDWLERTGNANVHHTTKKRPVIVFSSEKAHLRPVYKPMACTNNISSITRAVRKDNTILYKSNRYSVPLGTYTTHKELYIRITEEARLEIRKDQDGKILASHRLSREKGKLIQDTSHRRDRSQGISSYIQSLAEKFTDQTVASRYLTAIHHKYPRYVRDQLHIIAREIKEHAEVKNEALAWCDNRRIYSATEFRDVLRHLEQQRPPTLSVTDKEPEPLHLLTEKHQEMIHTQTQTRDVGTYLHVLKGGDVR